MNLNVVSRLLLGLGIAIIVTACGKAGEMPARDQPAAAAQSYTCPMHPHFISNDADASCPICGMDLVPASARAGASAPAGDTSGIAVSPEMVQTMGIRTAVVGRSGFGGDIRAYGEVQANTRLESVAASRLEGWIEDLSVRAEGDNVRRGALLYRIYSPALIGAQKDYLASLQIGNEKRIAAVRQRLKSIGLQNSAIQKLTETQTLIERIPVYAETGGTVTLLQVREGDYVKPGTSIMRLQSYKTVWVLAAIPEADLPLVSKGMTVRLAFESAADAPSNGVIDYIYPMIDPKTRTANVRISVDNKTGSLRPGAYADVMIEDGSAGDMRLSVPTQAVLRDSRGAHVVASLGDGKYESRAIKIGAAGNGRTEVLAGLSEGDLVVASGQFLLDSEANLREGLGKVGGVKPLFDHMTPLSDLPIDAAVLSRIDHLVDASLYLHEALIDGYAIDPYFLDPIIAIADGLESEFSGSRLAPIASNAKTALVAAKIDKTGPKLADHLSTLNTALDPWLTSGAPTHYKAKGLLFYSDPVSARTWLQERGLPANPYGGKGGDVIAWPDPMAVQ